MWVHLCGARVRACPHGEGQRLMDEHVQEVWETRTFCGTPTNPLEGFLRGGFLSPFCRGNGLWCCSYFWPKIPLASAKQRVDDVPNASTRWRCGPPTAADSPRVPIHGLLVCTHLQRTSRTVIYLTFHLKHPFTFIISILIGNHDLFAING